MAKKKDFWVSPSSLGLLFRCSFAWQLQYREGMRMPSNINFLLGGACHHAQDAVIKSAGKMDREEMRTIYKTEWDKKLAEPIYIPESVDLTENFHKGMAIVDLMADDFIDGNFPYKPINYYKKGKKESNIASEIGFRQKDVVNPVTGEVLDGVILNGYIDDVGIHEDLGFIAMDLKTGARAYHTKNDPDPVSPTKILKDYQLPIYDVAIRNMIANGQFPEMEMMGKKKVDRIMFRLYKKTKTPKVEVYHRKTTDAEINFLFDQIKMAKKIVDNELFCASFGDHCSNFCSLRPVCDLVHLKGMKPKAAFELHMKNINAKMREQNLDY